MTFLRTVALFAVFISGALFSPSSVASAQVVPNCSVFSRNLTLGVKGDDVKALQVLLNTNPATRISSDGPGSPGNETTYFGPKTRLAVAVFQEMHAKDVLAPAGLTKGSGFVGVFTRVQLSKFCVSKGGSGVKATVATTSRAIQTQLTASLATPVIPVNPPNQRQTSGFLDNQGKVISTVLPDLPKGSPVLANKDITDLYNMVSKKTNPQPSSDASVTTATPASFGAPLGEELSGQYLSEFVVSPGDSISVYAMGLDASNNVVHIGTTTIAELSPVAVGKLTFVVPTRVSYGSHDLWISNSRGESRPMAFIVKVPNAVAPAVASFTPTQGPLGTVVTVTGTGFTPTGNDVFGSGGKVPNISSSDGKTLQFPVTISIPGIEGEPGSHAELPFWFYVANRNGLSESSEFTVIIH